MFFKKKLIICFPSRKIITFEFVFKSNLFCFGDQFLYNRTLMAFLLVAKNSNLVVGVTGRFYK
jgi:hypothetical protein